MLILFDTNIILDILEKRQPFYEASKSVLEPQTGESFSLICWTCCKWRALTMNT